MAVDKSAISAIDYIISLHGQHKRISIFFLYSTCTLLLVILVSIFRMGLVRYLIFVFMQISFILIKLIYWHFYPAWAFGILTSQSVGMLRFNFSLADYSWVVSEHNTPQGCFMRLFKYEKNILISIAIMVGQYQLFGSLYLIKLNVNKTRLRLLDSVKCLKRRV